MTSNRSHIAHYGIDSMMKLSESTMESVAEKVVLLLWMCTRFISNTT